MSESDSGSAGMPELNPASEDESDEELELGVKAIKLAMKRSL